MIARVLFFCFVATTALSQTIPQSVQNDVAQLIQRSWSLKDSSKTEVTIRWSESQSVNSSRLECLSPRHFRFIVKSSAAEASSTLYYHLRHLGFLFPHPRIEKIPDLSQIKKLCGHAFLWKPRLSQRGFHLHTMHPSEWVAGYFMGQDQIAEDSHRWFVRNQQNILEIQMLQLTETEEGHLRRALFNAKSWGLKIGLAGSFAMIQQRSHNLIPLWRALFHWNENEALAENIKNFIQRFPVDFVGFELGSSEFTPTKPERTIAWMNTAALVLKNNNKGMYVKVHASSNQHDEKFGNFNFLPQYTDPHVGILPHTVFFYGLVDPIAPMYGRKDFVDMQKFYLQEAPKRPSLYYPETSYWVFMDIDAPLFLTDYLKIRTEDVDWMQDHSLDGQLNFSTGQELGYWLMDFQVALLADPASRNDPLFALKLLGEDPAVWTKIISWQNKFFKQKQMIQTLFFSNLIDESPFGHSIHEHILTRHFKDKQNEIQKEIALLEESLLSEPDLSEIKNLELKLMLEVTHLRLRHSLAIRKASLLSLHQSIEFDVLLNQAAKYRVTAFNKMTQVFKKFSRYPEVPLSEVWENPTSYRFGYLMTARSLELWERQESMIRENRISPFYKNRINPLRVILPRVFFEFFNWL